MYNYDEKYSFTEKWFDQQIPLWEHVFNSAYKKDIKEVLEIGCFEGRATIWLCDNILKAGTNYQIIDTFGGSLNESGMTNAKNQLEKNENIIYENFTKNIKFFEDTINFNISIGESSQILPTMVENRKFDFIYIDASHRSDDVFVDAYFANKMLNSRGLLIFDDFGWKDPLNPETVNSPESGIRQFFTFYEKEYTALHIGYQVVALKN